MNDFENIVRAELRYRLRLVAGLLAVAVPLLWLVSGCATPKQRNLEPLNVEYRTVEQGLPPFPGEAVPAAVAPPAEGFTKSWTVSWSIAAGSVTNRPASYTGVAATSNLELGTLNLELEELTAVPVNYYELRDTRTNSFGQPYQTWRAVTNDLQFSAVVTTTNRSGQIGAFTR